VPRAAQNVPAATTSNRTIFPENHRHRCPSEPETHQRPPSPDGRTLASCVHRQRRDQIAIAPESSLGNSSPAGCFPKGFRTTAPAQAESSRWAVQGVRAAVAGRRMAQPVYPQLRNTPCVPAPTLRARTGPLSSNRSLSALGSELCKIAAFVSKRCPPLIARGRLPSSAHRQYRRSHDDTAGYSRMHKQVDGTRAL
jgi:hypothetical protein